MGWAALSAARGCLLQELGLGVLSGRDRGPQKPVPLVWGSTFPPSSLGSCFDVTLGASGIAQESVLRTEGPRRNQAPRLSPTGSPQQHAEVDGCSLDAHFSQRGTQRQKGGSMLARTSDNSVRWSCSLRPRGPPKPLHWRRWGWLSLQSQWLLQAGRGSQDTHISSATCEGGPRRTL